MYALIENQKVVAISEFQIPSDGEIIQAESVKIGQFYIDGELVPFEEYQEKKSLSLDDVSKVLKELVENSGVTLSQEAQAVIESV